MCKLENGVLTIILKKSKTWSTGGGCAPSAVQYSMHSDVASEGTNCGTDDSFEIPSEDAAAGMRRL